MNSVNRTRKERILEVKRVARKHHTRKLAGVTLATAVTASSLFGIENKVGAAPIGTYTVKKGDTLTKISKDYHTTVKELKAVNGLSSDKIKVGQLLEVPTEKHIPMDEEEPAHIVQSGETLFGIARKHGVSEKDLMDYNQLRSDIIYPGQVVHIPTQAKPEENLKQAAIYTVVAGDSLWGIAKRFNVSVEEIKSLNRLKNEMVVINQKLIIKEDHLLSSAKVVGAADKFTVEFQTKRGALSLRVPYGTAELYQQFSGKDVFISHRNGALITIQ
ncbi:LysM peptidoglycan-binding domain-containing protein [Cytobacillus sp. FJAT-54145]|uniref:LysM peptidoglycan-binding domain-containing protein n=1 Tax=Cytobacillus spartinae TaxID=3299023 RepID=A0ABW6KC49_9BACI